MRATFQKKVQKKTKNGQNNWKFGQKCTKFENILTKGSLMCATAACMEQLEYALSYLKYDSSMWELPPQFAAAATIYVIGVLNKFIVKIASS